MSRPSIRVNQVGYLPDGPKYATLVSAAADPVAFTVVDAHDHVVLSGRSVPWPHRPEPTSGLDVQVLEFSALGTGDAFRVIAGDEVSHPFAVVTTLYRRLADDALRVLTLLRCRHDDSAVGCWTGPDARRLYPGWHQAGTFDVSGGWYDAGDYGKYVVSGAIALWQLADVALLLRRRGDPVPSELLEECRWQLDWILRMQVPPGNPLAGMAFHRVHGTEWSPLPGVPEDDPTTRVLHRPSTAATLHLAAVAAQGARLFADSDPTYADAALEAARGAYRAAHTEPVLIAPDDQGAFGGGPYGDPTLDDDYFWAAAELYLATESLGYDSDVRRSPLHHAPIADLDGFDFDRVTVPALLDLARSGDLIARDVVLAHATDLLRLQADQPWGQPYAPGDGWHWGSNGRVLNNLVVLGSAYELTGERRYVDAVAQGMDYLLGRNALGQSYVTGYGRDASRHQRTRLFGPQPPVGALAGGANSRENPGFPTDERLRGLPPQQCYLDEPTSETTNDICIRWNAPLVWVATFLGSSRSTLN